MLHVTVSVSVCPCKTLTPWYSESIGSELYLREIRMTSLISSVGALVYLVSLEKPDQKGGCSFGQAKKRIIQKSTCWKSPSLCRSNFRHNYREEEKNKIYFYSQVVVGCHVSRQAFMRGTVLEGKATAKTWKDFFYI